MAACAWLLGIHFDCHRWVLKDVPPPFQESICCLKFCKRERKKERNENHLNYKRKLRNGTQDETVQFPSQGDKNSTFNLKEEIIGVVSGGYRTVQVSAVSLLLCTAAL